MSAIIQLTFDGSMVRNHHQVALRDLAQAMISIQAAADRACLVVLRGDVLKHQRLPRENHEFVEFIVGTPREGSFVIDFLSEHGADIVRRMIEAIRNPYAAAVDEGGAAVYELGRQIEARRDMAKAPKGLISFDKLDTAEMPLVTRTYGDRSINKEFGQMLTPLAREPQGIMKLVLKESDEEVAQTYTFDFESAKKFKKVISKRELGSPVIYEGIVRELDRGTNKQRNFRGKFINAFNNKTVILHIADQEDFSSLIPLLDSDNPIKIIASPVIEFSSFDPQGGDIQFLELYHG